MDVSRSGLSALYAGRGYGTFSETTNPKDLVMTHVLYGRSSHSQSLKTSINEVFEKGSESDKRAVTQHLFDCIRNPSLSVAIRNEYEAIVRKLSLTNLDLHGINLSGLNCKDLILDFTGSNLSGADLSNVTLCSLNLTRTNSITLNLSNLTCDYLTITLADATNARLPGSKVKLANMFDATLNGVDLTNVEVGTLGLASRRQGIKVAMNNAKLDGIKLGHQSYFLSLDLTGSSAKNIDFPKMKIEDVIFNRVDMKGTRFDRHYFMDVSWTGVVNLGT